MSDPSTSGDAYSQAGVDYESLDAGKRMAMARALATSSLMAARGGRPLDASRGEPAFAFEIGPLTLALVIEGLGTKSVIARQVHEQLGLNRFADVAYDTVAAILNDLCCIGALPLVANAYFATGSSAWYEDHARLDALLAGWQQACLDASCTWGGGESPSLAGLVSDIDIELAGCALGLVPEGRTPILGQDLAPGDEIVILPSSGLHANGASLARMVAAGLPDGYATMLSDGRTFGEALLDPSVLYVPLVAALLERDIPITYISHITGHGLLKLMRPDRSLTYRITALPPVPPVLELLAAASSMEPAEAHRTLNMGSGLALYCPSGRASEILTIARELGFAAIRAGEIVEGPRQVVIESLGITYGSDQLDLSAR